MRLHFAIALGCFSAALICLSLPGRFSAFWAGWSVVTGIRNLCLAFEEERNEHDS